MDSAILSARIFTGNPKQPWAEALVIRDNKITVVGTNGQVKKACRRGTEILELKGRLVTPGFMDGHTHFVNFGLTLQRVDLRNLPSLSACRKRIRSGLAWRPFMLPRVPAAATSNCQEAGIFASAWSYHGRPSP